MLKLPSFPLPGVLNAGYLALLGWLNRKDEDVADAMEKLYPGSGAVVRAAYQRYETPVSQALDAVAMIAKAGVELGDAARTLHAFAKPDPTDAG